MSLPLPSICYKQELELPISVSLVHYLDVPQGKYCGFFIFTAKMPSTMPGT